MRCAGCCNPELLSFDGGKRLSVDVLARQINAEDGLEGVTFLGGEPFAHAGALAELGQRARALGLSVMVFTGYTLEQLRRADRGDWNALLAVTDLLVDGPFIEAQRSTERRWIGSTNQRIHALGGRYADLADRWDSGANTIELRLSGGRITVNGWPHEALFRTQRERRP